MTTSTGQTTHALLPQHRELLGRSAICPEVAEARGFESVTRVKQLLDLGFARAQAGVPGLLIPGHRVDGGSSHPQYRPDTPRTVNGKAPLSDGAGG